MSTHEQFITEELVLSQILYKSGPFPDSYLQLTNLRKSLCRYVCQRLLLDCVFELLF